MGLAHERFTSSTYSRREIALGYQGCVGLEYNPTTSSEAGFAWLPGDRSGMLAVNDLRLLSCFIVMYWKVTSMQALCTDWDCQSDRSMCDG